MPCNAAPRPEFSREDMDAVEIYYKAEIDRVTRVACEAIRVLKRNALYDELTKESQAWCHEHDAWDAARNLILRSARATVRRSTFDDDGENIQYEDGERPVTEDDIADLRVGDFEVEPSVDRELSRQVFEDSLYDWTETQQENDDMLDEAIAELDNEIEEPEA